MNPKRLKLLADKAYKLFIPFPSPNHMRSLLSTNNLIWIGLWFSAMVSCFDAPNMVALYVVIPLIFLYCFTRYKVFYENRYIVILSCLVLFILLSCLTTHYWDQTLKELKSLLGTLMLCYIIASLTKKEENRPYLYSLWLAYYIGMLLYIPQMDVFQDFDFSKSRLNDSQLNANTIAYHTFYITFSIYTLGDLVKSEKAQKFFCRFFFFIIPLSAAVALITGSRQVLLIQVPLIVFLIWARYKDRVRSARTFIIGIIAMAGVFLFAADKGQTIYENSVLATRYEKKLEKDSRPKLIKDAFEVGCQHPILGVGPGNYVRFSYNRHFSHCTYTELFANNGIFAVGFYLLLLFTFLKRQFQYYRATNDKLFLAFLIFGIIYVFDNIFYVFHTMLWLFPFFFLVASHSEYYYKELQHAES